MKTLPLLASLWTACSASDPVDDPNVAGPEGSPLRVALFTDPHVIASDYVCCESPGLDTESITQTNARLEGTRDRLHAISPRPEHVFIDGDIFHQNYKWETLEEYDQHETSAGNAAALLETFEIPVDLTWGNHDYEVPEFSREFSHALFDRLFGRQPYTSVTLGGWKFLLANTMLGRTWDPTDPAFNTSNGSFGRDQLAWMDAELSEGLPTFLFFHHPVYVVDKAEDPDGPIPGIEALIERHRDTLQAIFVGHTHRWIDLTEVYGLPYYVVAATRYDSDNFWLIDLARDGSSWSIPDMDKAIWGTVEADTWDYTAP
jgi:hypothetical protein